MVTQAFETRGISSAALTLLTTAVGVITGIIVSSTVTGLILTLVGAQLFVVALSFLRPARP